MKRLLLLIFAVFSALFSFAQQPDTIKKKVPVRLVCYATVIPDSLMPLYISEGKILSSAQVKAFDPSYIEVLKVLNTPEHTAVYGLRGAKGVIILTFKKGAKWIELKSLLAKHKVSRAERSLPVVKGSGLWKSELMMVMNRSKFHIEKLSADGSVAGLPAGQDYLRLTEITK